MGTSVGSIRVVSACFPNCVDKWFQLLHSQMRCCRDNMRKQLIDLLLSKCELHFGCVRLLHHSNKSTCQTVSAFRIRVPPNRFYQQKLLTTNTAGNVLLKPAALSCLNPPAIPHHNQKVVLCHSNVLPQCWAACERNTTQDNTTQNYTKEVKDVSL